MVKLYVKNIMSGRITLENVPTIYKDKVEAALREKFVKGEITEAQLNRYLGFADKTAGPE